VDAEVVDHEEEEGEAEQGGIEAVGFRPHRILYGSLYAEDVEWFDKQVDKDQKQDVDQEFSVHSGVLFAKVFSNSLAGRSFIRPLSEVSKVTLGDK
jgi:hypothetical protein